MAINLATVEKRYPVGYRVYVLWDKADAVPFGTTHASRELDSKREAWEYVKRVRQRAAISHVQLHRISIVALLNTGDEHCVWQH